MLKNQRRYLIIKTKTKACTTLWPCLGPRAPEARRVNANAAGTSLLRFFLAQLKLPLFASGAFLKRASDAICLAGLCPRLAFKRRRRGPKQSLCLMLSFSNTTLSAVRLPDDFIETLFSGFFCFRLVLMLSF